MEKYELSYDKDAEIVQAIKDIILSKYPIVEDIWNISFDHSTAIDINLRFCRTKENEDFTQILFCCGTEKARSSIPERINVNGLVSLEAIIDLMRFILNDHDYLRDIQKMHNNGLQLYFGIGEKEQCINCGTIGLNLDFCHHPNNMELLKFYLKGIINNFYEQLQHTERFKREYEQYCTLIKQDIINSLTDEDLHTFINLLENHVLRDMLGIIPNNLFMRLYDEFETQKSNKGKRLEEEKERPKKEKK